MDSSKPTPSLGFVAALNRFWKRGRLDTLKTSTVSGSSWDPRYTPYLRHHPQQEQYGENLLPHPPQVSAYSFKPSPACSPQDHAQVSSAYQPTQIPAEYQLAPPQPQPQEPPDQQPPYGVLWRQQGRHNLPTVPDLQFDDSPEENSQPVPTPTPGDTNTGRPASLNDQPGASPTPSPRPESPGRTEPTAISVSEQPSVSSIALSLHDTVAPAEIQGLTPPSHHDPLQTPGIGSNSMEGQELLKQSGLYDTSKSTCSLNLVCYRSGARGGPCLEQVHTVLRSRFKGDDAAFRHFTEELHPEYIVDDEGLFTEMRRLYDAKMCGFFRRYFSLKSLRSFRILSYTPTTRPVPVPIDDFSLQEIMFAYRRPESITSGPGTTQWIEWVFRLRAADKRHAVEFVEGWNSARIAAAGTVPWLSSCLVGIIWASRGGDTQTAFTVAGFILSSLSFMVALLAVVSSIES